MRKGQFKKGKKPGPGRPKGCLNKYTEIRKHIFSIYNKFQNEKKYKKYSLEEWGKGNTTEFYKLVKGLMPRPVELTGKLGDGDDAPIRFTIVDAKKNETRTKSRK